MGYFDRFVDRFPGALFFTIFVILIALIVMGLGCSTEKYTDVEKHIIQQLREKMHDPASLEIVNITSVDFYDYEHLEKLPMDLRLVMATLSLENPKVYTIDYRGKNAFGALRLNSIMAAAGKHESIKDFFSSFFFSEDDLITDNK